MGQHHHIGDRSSPREWASRVWRRVQDADGAVPDHLAGLAISVVTCVLLAGLVVLVAA